MVNFEVERIKFVAPPISDLEPYNDKCETTANEKLNSLIDLHKVKGELVSYETPCVWTSINGAWVVIGQGKAVFEDIVE